MKKFLLIALLAGPLFGFGQLHDRYTLNFIPNDQYPGGSGQIPFLKFLPPDYSESGTRKFPLIIFLHGQGETGYGDQAAGDITRLTSVGLPKYLTNPNATMQFTDTNGVTQSFVVLVPQKHKNDLDENGFERQWPAYYIDAMLDYAKNNINIAMPFFYDDEFINHLIEARKRGVNVNVFVPHNNQNKIINDLAINVTNQVWFSRP